jgi:hypothetical protein
MKIKYTDRLLVILSQKLLLNQSVPQVGVLKIIYMSFLPNIYFAMPNS